MWYWAGLDGICVQWQQYWLSCPTGVTGLFFLTTAKVPLTKPDFISIFRGILDSIGLPAADYAGHSFRNGAAISAVLAGVEDSKIQLLGQWQSAAFLRYIPTAHE